MCGNRHGGLTPAARRSVGHVACLTLTTLPRLVSATFFFRSSRLQVLSFFTVNAASFLAKLMLTESDSTHGRERSASATALVQALGQVMPSIEATYFPAPMVAVVTNVLSFAACLPCDACFLPASPASPQPDKATPKDKIRSLLDKAFIKGTSNKQEMKTHTRYNRSVSERNCHAQVRPPDTMPSSDATMFPLLWICRGVAPVPGSVACCLPTASEDTREDFVHNGLDAG